MSYSQMISKADKEQQIELEIESTLLKFEKLSSSLGYDIDDEIRSRLTDAVDLMVNDKHTVRGFRSMTLSQYDEAYRNTI